MALVLAVMLLPPASAAAATAACPADQSGDALEDWRDVQAKLVVDGKFKDVKANLRSCFPGPLPECLEDLSYYAKLRASGANTWSLEDDKHRPDRLTMRSETDLPPEFLVRDKTTGQPIPGQIAFPKNLFEIAKEKGWKALSYKTRSTGGFNIQPNLTLVVIPGKDKDIYIQISPQPDADEQSNKTRVVPKPETGSLTDGQNTAAMITVDKSVRPPVAQLRLMSKDENTGGYVWSNNTKTNMCMKCHASPLRSISPRGYHVTDPSNGKMTPDQEQTVSEINNMMNVEGLTWGTKTIDGLERKFGPPVDGQPVGWAPKGSATRKEEFIRKCTEYVFLGSRAERPPIAWQKIAQAMNCVDCHNGKIRGVLTSGTFDDREIAFKIVGDKSMPFAHQLTDPERAVLEHCLESEGYTLGDAWKKSGEWMKRSFCEDFKAPGAKPAGSNPAKIAQ